MTESILIDIDTLGVMATLGGISLLLLLSYLLLWSVFSFRHRSKKYPMPPETVKSVDLPLELQEFNERATAWIKESINLRRHVDSDFAWHPSSSTWWKEPTGVRRALNSLKLYEEAAVVTECYDAVDNMYFMGDCHAKTTYRYGLEFLATEFYDACCEIIKIAESEVLFSGLANVVESWSENEEKYIETRFTLAQRQASKIVKERIRDELCKFVKLEIIKRMIAEPQLSSPEGESVYQTTPEDIERIKKWVSKYLSID